MKPIIKIKEDEVKVLAKQLSEAKSIIVFEYLGLTAKELTALRKKLHAANAKMYVSKNNIYARAVALAKLPGFVEFSGPNAILISNGDEIAPFKELNEIIKTHAFVKYKDGILEAKHIRENELTKIASIPNREGLLSMLLSCLQASIRNLAYGVNAIAKQKQQ
ncbi:MAG: 50S ribosomal protein L10 [Mycoplasmataceae bacterium]|jgi:large subunit ribosomal protein L10|nr:50S ribosomal protein L10 [Mycoplasmataceae bacterium]